MESIGYSLVAVGVLLAANAFFVAAEFALVKVRPTQLGRESQRMTGSTRYASRSAATTGTVTMLARSPSTRIITTPATTIRSRTGWICHRWSRAQPGRSLAR